MIRFRSNSRLGFTASQRVTQQGASAHQAAAHDSRPNRRAAKPIEKQAGDNGSDRVADAGHEQGFDADAFRAQARQISFLISIFVTVIAVCVSYYYAKGRAPQKSIRGLSSGITISRDIGQVYEYVSTPDFRTEWHFASIEVSGPAIDHSAVPGEIFAEEVRVGAQHVMLEWHVLERQFPTSPSTQFAEFVLEGAASPEDKHGKPLPRQVWRQMLRLRAGRDYLGDSPQVQLELELLVDGKDPKHLDPQWKKQLKKSIQSSLENVKDRVEEMPLSAEMLKQQNKKRRQEKERVEKEAGGGKAGVTAEAASSGGKDGAANKEKKKAKKDKKK